MTPLVNGVLYFASVGTALAFATFYLGESDRVWQVVALCVLAGFIAIDACQWYAISEASKTISNYRYPWHLRIVDVMALGTALISASQFGKSEAATDAASLLGLAAFCAYCGLIVLYWGMVWVLPMATGDLFTAMTDAGFKMDTVKRRQWWSIATMVLYGVAGLVAWGLRREHVPELLMLLEDPWASRALWLAVATGVYGMLGPGYSRGVRGTFGVLAAPGILLFVRNIARLLW